MPRKRAPDPPSPDDPTDEAVPAPPPATPRQPKGTAVDAMATEDRELVTRTTRRAYQVLEVMVEKIWDQVAGHSGMPNLNRDNLQSMLNLQRMAAGMIDKHPGLLAEVQAQGVDPEATDEDLDRVLEALDL